jgi:hypothetical protein
MLKLGFAALNPAYGVTTQSRQRRYDAIPAFVSKLGFAALNPAYALRSTQPTALRCNPGNGVTAQSRLRHAGFICPSARPGAETRFAGGD